MGKCKQPVQHGACGNSRNVFVKNQGPSSGASGTVPPDRDTADTTGSETQFCQMRSDVFAAFNRSLLSSSSGSLPHLTGSCALDLESTSRIGASFGTQITIKVQFGGEAVPTKRNKQTSTQCREYSQKLTCHCKRNLITRPISI